MSDRISSSSTNSSLEPSSLPPLFMEREAGPGPELELASGDAEGVRLRA